MVFPRASPLDLVSCCEAGEGAIVAVANVPPAVKVLAGWKRSSCGLKPVADAKEMCSAVVSVCPLPITVKPDLATRSEIEI